MAAAASTTSSSSSVVVLKAEDLLDTADSATVDSRTRWPEAAGTQSTFVVQPVHSTIYRIPKGYALLNAKDWVACDVPPEGYNVVCAYAAAFERGMRLPFHDLHAAVLRHYGLAPSQLMPNAWRYLNAFVLLCEDAGVDPTLPVFQSFFVLCADRGVSVGRYHFKPYRYPLSPPSDSGRGSGGRCRLFTGKMPQATWKDRFLFVRGPSGIPWPCPMKWGTPSKASVEEPVLTADTTEAIHRLVLRAGDTGIDIMKFLSARNPPVGRLLQIPVPAQRVVVKQEAVAAAVALTEQTRKRKSPEPISLSPLSLRIESPPAPAGVGLGHGEPNIIGDEGSCFRKLLHYFEQEAMALFDDKVQELQALRGDLQMVRSGYAAEVVRLQEQLVGDKAKHATAMGQLVDELQKAKDKASRCAEELQKAKDKASQYAEELQKAKAEVRHMTIKHGREQMELEREKNGMVQDAYDKGVRDTKKYMVDMYGDTTNISEFTKEIESLLSGSSPPPGPGLAPQAPVDDQ